jgi:hypothetical protein
MLRALFKEQSNKARKHYLQCQPKVAAGMGENEAGHILQW